MKIKQKVLLLILTIAIVRTFMPVIAFADDHQVTTVQKDTYVYCGGTYDLEVAPPKDSKGKPLYTAKSYAWHVKLKTDAKNYHADCIDSEDPYSWYYDTTTPHFKMNMKNFINGSKYDDWEHLKFYCEVTDTNGKTHWSEDFTMRVGSRNEFQAKWKADPDASEAVSVSGYEPAEGDAGITEGSGILELAMHTGESRKFSFTPVLDAPYWLAESDPYLENSISIISADGGTNQLVTGTSYNFKPAKAGDYLIMMYSHMKLGDPATGGYDPYFADADGPAAGMGWSQCYHVTVTVPEADTYVRETLTAIQGGTIFFGQEGDVKTYTEVPAAGATIPEVKIYPTNATKSVGTVTDSPDAAGGKYGAGWYTYTDKGWQSCQSLGKTVFEGGKSYRYMMIITAKGDYKFGIDERSVDATPLRSVMVYDAGTRVPTAEWETKFPNKQMSVPTRAVYVVRSFTVPESAEADAAETPGADDAIDKMPDADKDPSKKMSLPELFHAEGITNAVYSGKKITHPVVVTDGSETLTKGTDYTVKYSCNKDVGTAHVDITGIGDYTGTLNETFDIIPVGKSIKSVSAAKKALTVKWNMQSKKMSKKRISGYEVRYSTNSDMSDATTVKVKGYKSTTKKLTGLKSGTRYYVQLRTYLTNGNTYYSKWSKAVSKKTK